MSTKFEDIYKIPTMCLKVNGAHPSVPRGLKWLIHFCLLHGCYTVGCIFFIYNMIFIDVKSRDLQSACSHGIFIVLYFVVTFKYVVLVWYQDIFNKMIRLQEQYFESTKTLPLSDQQIANKYVKKGQWVGKLWLVSSTMTVGMFVVNGIIISAYSFYKGNFKLVPLAENVYPSAIDEIKERLDIFIILYVLHVSYGMYSVTMYSGFTPLGPVFILNTCARVELLTKRVEQMFKENEVSEQNIEIEMKKIIQDTQDIYSFVEHINTTFKVFYEMSLKASAIMIPITSLLILENFKNGELGLDYIMFVYAASLFCFVPCYYSDLLMEKSEQLRDALYASGWENFYNRSIRSTLLILLIRAARPMSIRTVFRVVCLDTFAELCHQAYALFSVMNAAFN